MFSQTPEKLRCVTCNLKNIELDTDKHRKAGVSTGKQAQTQPVQVQKQMKQAEVVTEKTEEEELEIKVARKQTTYQRQQMYKLNKVMD